MAHYIQYKAPGLPLETVDEFPTRREARAALAEYVMAYPPDSRLYVSTRPCNSWKQ